MPCERYRDALTEAAAGEPVAPALAAHLEGCAACRSELQALRRLMTAADDELSALATAEPSPALRARIRDAGAAPGPAFRWGFAWTATAAAVLALAALGAWRASVVHAPSSPAVATNAAPTAVPRPRASAPPPSAPAAVVSAPTAGSGMPPSESNTEAASVRRAVAASLPARREPEVIIPPGEQAALLRYVALVHERKAGLETLQAIGQPMSDLKEKRLVIAPVEIVPLDPAEAQGT